MTSAGRLPGTRTRWTRGGNSCGDRCCRRAWCCAAAASLAHIDTLLENNSDHFTYCICFPGCYTYTVWGVFASVGQIGRIDAFLRRAYKCGISKYLFTFQELLRDSGAMLFRKMQSSMHCLNTLLPPKKTIDYVLRNSDTSYVLPKCF